jgi:membrane protein DedA with SNARE-associated domain
LEQFLDYINDFADQPLVVFCVMFFGGLLNTFFPPVPIEVGAVFAGYLISQGHGSILITISAATLGMSVGSAILYQIAKVHGKSIIKMPFFARFINEKVLKRIEVWLENYGVPALLVTKFIPGAYFCAVVGSGILSIKRVKFFITIFFVNLLAFTLHVYVGKIAGENWRHVYRAVGRTGFFIVVLIAVAAGLMFLTNSYFRKKLLAKPPPKS